MGYIVSHKIIVHSSDGTGAHRSWKPYLNSVLLSALSIAAVTQGTNRSVCGEGLKGEKSEGFLTFFVTYSSLGTSLF